VQSLLAITAGVINANDTDLIGFNTHAGVNRGGTIVAVVSKGGWGCAQEQHPAANTDE
jgi:hypothetical protein